MTRKYFFKKIRFYLTQKEKKDIIFSFPSMPYTLICSSQRTGKDEQETITDFEKMSKEQGKAL